MCVLQKRSGNGSFGSGSVARHHMNRRYTYLKVNEKGCIMITDLREYRNEVQIITLKSTTQNVLEKPGFVRFSAKNVV